MFFAIKPFDEGFHIATLDDWRVEETSNTFLGNIQHLLMSDRKEQN